MTTSSTSRTQGHTSSTTSPDYPAHLYDPLRRRIAAGYIRHELRKLFPSIRDVSVWSVLDANVDDWITDGESSMPVRAFWNLVYGLSMGFRLKNIVPWLTSASILWHERRIDVDELHFDAKLEDLFPIGERPSARRVRAWYSAPRRAQARKVATARAVAYAGQTAPRCSYPILVVRRHGVLRVLDGNRRLLHVLLDGGRQMEAVIGEPTSDMAPSDAWIPTSLLIQLVDVHRAATAAGRDITDAVATIVNELVQNSGPARIELERRSVSLNVAQDLELVHAVGAKLERMRNPERHDVR